MRGVILFIPVWLYANCLAAQDAGEPVDALRLLPDLIYSPDEDRNYEDIYENLAQVLSSPLDLNTAGAEELRNLFILSDTQIENFLAYRNLQGKLIDIHELQVVPGFDYNVISKLLPFVRIVDPVTRVNSSLFGRLFSPGHSYFVLRHERTLETKKGFRSSAGSKPSFTGSPDKVYFRFRSSISGDFSIGITAEKDPGESLYFAPRNRQWGFDFTSYHVQIRNKGMLKNLIAGDFHAQFGQGLVLGSAFGLGKGAESVATARRSNSGFQPYTSIHESMYQRGVAVTLHPAARIEASAFYSRVYRDASLSDDGDSTVLTSLQRSGYHRTENELTHRKAVREHHTGLVVQYENQALLAGLLVDHINFDTPVRPTPRLYNQFVFTGSRNTNAGAYLNFRFQNMSFFSEFARSLQGGTGIVAGMLISADVRLEIVFLYRDYQRNFFTFYSSAFSENTQPQNEQGVYWGWKYRWNRQYSLSGYVDQFKFPWLGFRRYRPSTGFEWLIRGNYNPSRSVSVSVQFREESRESNLADAVPVYKVAHRIRRSVAVNCDYGPVENIRLRSRVQFNLQDLAEGTTQGWAFVQDIGFSVGKFEFTGRHGLFDSEHNDNRQYVYESDAWSAYSLPAYSGVGVRNFALIEYKVSKRLTIWLRYARTSIKSDGEIGSGNEAIEGNTKNDVKFQARLNF